MMGEKDVMSLFKEALEAENVGDLERAKRKLDEVMELTKERDRELYFEACFRLAEIFIQEDNYRGAIKCAVRAIHRAPNEELYRLGIKRLGDILFIMRREGRLDELSESMEVTLGLVKENEELHRFLKALMKMAKGEKTEESFSTEELNEILELLKK